MDAPGPLGATQLAATVIENRAIAERTYRLRLEAPAIARSIRPGQFLMVRSTSALDPLLARPFALYELGEGGTVEVIYLVVGRGTAALAQRRPGDVVSAWGPLGRPFGPPPPGGDLIMVAGGIGQTPFLSLARWWLGRAEYGGEAIARPAGSARLLYGVRSASLAAGLDDFAAAGIEVDLATDDGSAGYRGYVTDLLRDRLARGEVPAKLVGCGPAPMLAALAKVAAEYQIPCDVSLENQMACGFGACFSCVAPIRQADGSTDLRRVCLEGPVFAAGDVAW